VQSNYEEMKYMNEQAMSRHDLEAKIVRRGWENEEFRKEFEADPAGTFARHLGVPAAALPKIVVHEEQPGSWHIVLPVKPANSVELSERDLEQLAGGSTPGCLGIGTVVIAVVGSGAASAAVAAGTAAAVQNLGGW
jgi:hypothetical protein